MRRRVGNLLVVIGGAGIGGLLIGFGMLIPWADFWAIDIPAKLIFAGLVLAIPGIILGAILLDEP